MAHKKELSLEYVIPCNASTLFRFLKSDTGLGEWFADSVKSVGDKYDFFWGNIPHKARLISYKDNSYARFVWEEDEGSEYFFEMKISVTPLTKEVALLVTDYAEEDDMDDLESIWDSGVKKLRRRLGVA